MIYKMKNKITIVFISLSLLSLCFFSSCEPDAADLPIVTYYSHTDFLNTANTNSLAIRFAVEEGESGLSVLEYGICYSLNQDPSISDNTIVLGSGVFNHMVSLCLNEDDVEYFLSISPSASYYHLNITVPGTYNFRLYAKNDNGIQYSSSFSAAVE